MEDCCNEVDAKNQAAAAELSGADVGSDDFCFYRRLLCVEGGMFLRSGGWFWGYCCLLCGIGACVVPQ